MLHPFPVAARSTVASIAALFTVALVAPPVAAQAIGAGCTSGELLAPAAATGRVIHSVRISKSRPARVAGFNAPLHATTRDGTIRQRLLFAAGDRVDTLQLAESLRRIRRLRFISGATILASCSDDGNAVDVTVATRDAWSLQPQFRASGSSTAVVGVSESNVLGTGRGARVYLRTDRGQASVGAAFSDPAILGSSISGSVNRDVYRDGSAWAATARTRDASAFEPTHVIAMVTRSSHMSVSSLASGISGDTVNRAAATLVGARRIGRSETGASFLQLGLEGERTVVAARADRSLVGPTSIRRSFVGVDVGAARQTLAYAAVPWIAPPAALRDSLLANGAEVPLGWTADGIVGFGRDFTTRQPTAHVDAWAGRVWPLGGTSGSGVPRGLLSTDLWASGYRSLGSRQREWSATSLRSALALEVPASRGLWSAELSAEHLADPDPDTRGLAMNDPVLRAIPPASRLAETAMSGGVERSFFLLPTPGRYMFGVALFAAGSMRWDPASRVRDGAVGDPPAPEILGPGSERLYVGSVGAGMLLTPLHFGRSIIRLDVGYPVLHSPGVSRHPYFSLSVVPSFGTARSRTGTQ